MLAGEDGEKLRTALGVRARLGREMLWFVGIVERVGPRFGRRAIGMGQTDRRTTESI